MKFVRYALLAAAVLAAVAAQSGAVTAQEKGQEQVQDSPLLFAELQVQSYNGDAAGSKLTFTESRPVKVSLTAKNNNSVPIVIQVTDLKFAQYSPQLMKDGQLMEYAPGVEERITAQRNPARGSNKFREVAPGKVALLDTLDLSDWYGHLKPGVYELRVTCRLPRNADRDSDNALTFEVLP